MSVQNVRDAITRFLTDKTPQVLCIRGAWGTGKTYTWDDVLTKVAHAKDTKIAYTKYAKVSLFGLNSIQEIKREIFSTTNSVEKIGAEFDITDYKDIYSKAKSSPIWSKVVGIFNENAMDAAIEALAAMARNQLICIDDLERKGKDLRSADVLGYISHLRDVRKCSVVLLLNDEQLEDKDEFESYLEKVVDVYLRFEPSCIEIADIAVPEAERDTVGLLVRDNAVTLGITNVRVIQKILRLVRDIVPMISEYSFQVTKSATATITLMAWSYLQPEYAPSIDYLKRMTLLGIDDKEDEDDAKWLERLGKYGYSHTSEFDLLLLRGVQNGFFVKSEIDTHALELHRADVRELMKTELDRLWKGLRDSFTTTEEEILNDFYEAFCRNDENIQLSEMIRIEELFRDFGDPRADAILSRYIEVNKDRPRAFDLSFFEDYGEKLDPDVHLKLLQASIEQQPDWTPTDLLKGLESFVYAEEKQLKAAEMPVEDYIAVFKAHEGEELYDLLAPIRKYVRVINPSEPMITIMDKAGAALREIGKENRLNYRRAMNTGLVQRLEAREKGVEVPSAED
ncbi:hypothetical protein HFN53_04715 [Rhizobium leguminosarum]|nr:hypothetical protein [Rhizobium leguminosarum]